MEDKEITLDEFIDILAEKAAVERDPAHADDSAVADDDSGLLDRIASYERIANGEE